MPSNQEDILISEEGSQSANQEEIVQGNEAQYQNNSQCIFDNSDQLQEKLKSEISANMEETMKEEKSHISNVSNRNENFQFNDPNLNQSVGSLILGDISLEENENPNTHSNTIFSLERQLRNNKDNKANSRMNSDLSKISFISNALSVSGDEMLIKNVRTQEQVFHMSNLLEFFDLFSGLLFFIPKIKKKIEEIEFLCENKKRFPIDFPVLFFLQIKFSNKQVHYSVKMNKSVADCFFNFKSNPKEFNIDEIFKNFLLCLNEEYIRLTVNYTKSLKKRGIFKKVGDFFLKERGFLFKERDLVMEHFSTEILIFNRSNSKISSLEERVVFCSTIGEKNWIKPKKNKSSHNVKKFYINSDPDMFVFLINRIEYKEEEKTLKLDTRNHFLENKTIYDLTEFLDSNANDLETIKEIKNEIVKRNDRMKELKTQNTELREKLSNLKNHLEEFSDRIRTLETISFKLAKKIEKLERKTLEDQYEIISIERYLKRRIIHLTGMILQSIDSKSFYLYLLKNDCWFLYKEKVKKKVELENIKKELYDSTKRIWCLFYTKDGFEYEDDSFYKKKTIDQENKSIKIQKKFKKLKRQIEKKRDPWYNKYVPRVSSFNAFLFDCFMNLKDERYQVVLHYCIMNEALKQFKEGNQDTSFKWVETGFKGQEETYKMLRKNKIEFNYDHKSFHLLHSELKKNFEETLISYFYLKRALEAIRDYDPFEYCKKMYLFFNREGTKAFNKFYYQSFKKNCLFFFFYLSILFGLIKGPKIKKEVDNLDKLKLVGFLEVCLRTLIENNKYEEELPNVDLSYIITVSTKIKEEVKIPKIGKLIDELSFINSDNGINLINNDLTEKVQYVF